MHNICFYFLMMIGALSLPSFLHAMIHFENQELFDTTPEDGLDVPIILSEKSAYRIVRYPYLLPRGQTHGFGAELQIDCDKLPDEASAYLMYRKAVEEIWSALVATSDIRPYLFSYPIELSHLYISLQFIPKKTSETNAPAYSFMTRKGDSIYIFCSKEDLQTEEWQKKSLSLRPYPGSLFLHTPVLLEDRHVSILKLPSFWYKEPLEQALASFASTFAKENNIEFINLGMSDNSPLNFLFFSQDLTTLDTAKKISRAWILSLIKGLRHDAKLKCPNYRYLQNTQDKEIATSPILSEITTLITLWTKEFKRPSFPYVAAIRIENGKIKIQRATTDGELTILFEDTLSSFLQKK